MSDKFWCEEYQDYYGNQHPEYGGKLTDLRTLPVGKEFFVTDGCWFGKILADNRVFIYCPTGDFIIELTEQYHSLYVS